jgi:N-acetylneuraminic acid mutarotase
MGETMRQQRRRNLHALVVSSALIFAAAPGLSAADDWQLLAPMGQSRYSGGFGAINGKLYATNGFIRNSTEVYDPATNQWTFRAPSPAGRAAVGSALIGDSLYLISGCFNADCRTGFTDLVERYDTATDTWQTLAPIPTRRTHPATAVINGKIHAAGGGVNCPPCVPQSAAHEVFDPVTNAWSSFAPLPTAREGAAAAAVGGRFYVIGGLSIAPGIVVTPSSAVDIYDPATNTWSAGTPMPTARGYVATAVADGLIHVMAGTSNGGATMIATHEVYDPIADTWTTRAPLPIPRIYGMGAAIGSNVYIAGGYDNSLFDIESLEVYSAGDDVLEVAIDIKPGDSVNSINPGSRGVVPVAILSNPSFDARDVDPGTISLSGASVRVTGNEMKYSCSVQDIDGDGRLDLLCHVETAQLMLQPGDSVAVLEAETYAGQPIRGQDTVRTVG